MQVPGMKGGRQTARDVTQTLVYAYIPWSLSVTNLIAALTLEELLDSGCCRCSATS